MRELLGRFPVVGLVGPRQVGKTTLARIIAAERGEQAVFLDLERPSHLARLADPELFLSLHTERLVVIDEAQLVPSLFSVLRPLVDERRRPGRFLLLGSASPTLIQAGSESLAGRIVWQEMIPFDISELPHTIPWRSHWWRGGFPDELLAPDAAGVRAWQEAFLRTWVERDLAVLGRAPSPQRASRLLQMVAHRHGQMWNAQDFAASLGVSIPTVNATRDRLVDGFMLRLLQPFYSNVEKRLIKRPKAYVRDSGLLHALAGIRDTDELAGHPLIGPSFEGYVLAQVEALMPPDLSAYFYQAHGGAEIDLVLARGQRIVAAIEIKHSSAPTVTRGFYTALTDLGGPPAWVVHPGVDRWPIAAAVEAVGVCEVPAIIRALA